MMLRAILLATAATACLSACVVSGPYPGGRAYVDVAVAPPPERIVIAPAVRPGYVWAPGYWRWDGRRHVWQDGRYVHERGGYHWHAAHWEEHNGRYHLEEGRWER
jgi:hypothetical protein